MTEQVEDESWEALAGSGLKACALCPAPSTMSLTVMVLNKVKEGGKSRKSVANRTVSLCEPCAKTSYKNVLALISPKG